MIPCEQWMARVVNEAQDTVSALPLAAGTAGETKMRIDTLRKFLDTFEGLCKEAVERGEVASFGGKVWGPVPKKAPAKPDTEAMEAAGRLTDYKSAKATVQALEKTFSTRGPDGVAWCWHNLEEAPDAG